MSAIPSLWPADIRADVRTPAAILRFQEGALSARTQGLLTAKLGTTWSEDQVEHALDIVAPPLHFYRAQILTARHAEDLPYPVTVTAAVFPQQSPDLLDGPNTPGSRVAQSEDEFIELVRTVLASPSIRSLISSLIARINSDRETANPPPADSPPVG